jgi:hypothetical protein
MTPLSCEIDPPRASTSLGEDTLRDSDPRKMWRRVILCYRDRCGSAPTTPILGRSIEPDQFQENCMYIGGGLLGAILFVVLIIWLLRRV